VLEQLLLHIQRHQLCKITDKILLAVSGGIDSMVMLQLFIDAGYPIAVAHCNFQLRGADSDADEALVKKICDQHKIPFFVQRFDTSKSAKESGLSIQLAARKLRYDFFESIRSENGYQFVATAHHLNDSIETVLLNLTKGTGLKGLTGIPVKNNFIIRPLLFASREIVLDYAKAKQLEWREDSSNLNDDYQRNFLRHEVIPRLKEINPNLEQTFESTLERMSGASEMNQKFLDDFRSTSWNNDGDNILINRVALQKHNYPHVILWELLKSKGFNYDQCRDAIETSQSGKQFYSPTHYLTVDRESLIVSERNQTEILEVLIEDGQQCVSNGFQILDIEKKKGLREIDRRPSVAMLDASKIIFPLRWRKWENGDAFQPLGMATHKKVSDLLIDLKIPLPEKENVTVVESGGRIVWVVGHRIGDEFKITPTTTVSITLAVRKLEQEKIS
jgi:tRNA(Ile)-lysidine synthase